MPIHFGVKVCEGKYGLRLEREKYAIVNNKSSFNVKLLSVKYADEVGKIYSDDWCENHLNDCLKNYDLSMEYFSLLNREEFNNEINSFLNKNKKFVEVSDLNLYSGKSGYYIMVLDDYCQVYIGTTDNIKMRIQQHWSVKKPFDRLLFPMGAIDTSILSIDSFRAFDTTRIYAYVTRATYNKEDKFISKISSQFMCNRIGGGKITGGLLQTLGMMKSRSLSVTVPIMDDNNLHILENND